MRERRRVAIDRHTGAVSGHVEIIDDQAGFAQRVRELKESLPDIGLADARAARIVCNGCGAAASLDFDDPRLPRGWVSCDTGDFCPGCQSLS
jgi:hypothetical protein